jgi:hypothetical protein
VMISRRLMESPFRPRTATYHIDDAGVLLRHGKIECPTSEMGQKRT